MSCINPLPVFQIINGRKTSFEVPCGHCLNCLIKKQSALEFLCKRELITRYQKGQGASFVTLTYDDNHLPINDLGIVTLRRRDVQLFIKNMRRQMEYYETRQDFKYIYCGEYGDNSARPHYHIIFLGLTDTEVKLYTSKLWKHGLCDVGPLGQGGIRYVLKYMSKSLPSPDIKQLREDLHVENPFVYHSIGMGKEWIDNNLQRIVDNNFTFNINGQVRLFPKYVMRYVSAHTGVDYIPYVKQFLFKKVLPIAKSQGLMYSQYDFENSFIRYKNNIACLRSQNRPVEDITSVRCWVKPVSYGDRSFNSSKLLDKINFTDKSFNFSKKIIPRKKDGSVNWDLYLYGDVVPF